MHPVTFHAYKPQIAQPEEFFLGSQKVQDLFQAAHEKNLRKIHDLLSNQSYSSYQLRSVLIEAKDQDQVVKSILDHGKSLLTKNDAVYVLSNTLVQHHQKSFSVWMERSSLLDREGISLLASTLSLTQKERQSLQDLLDNPS